MTLPIDLAAGHAGHFALSRTANELELIFIQCGLRPFLPNPRSGPQRWAKNELVATTLHGALSAASNVNANDGLRRFICHIAAGLSAADLVVLQEAARSAGWELRVSDSAARLYPLDEPNAPLSQMITALEFDFDRLGLGTAKNHYRQAIESLIAGMDEAANSQLRATFEEVVVRMAERNGFVRKQQGEGGRAIKHLIDNDHLEPSDGGDYIRGLWKIVQTNGPHPGTSSAGEAHFRTQAITAATRYLVDRFAPA